MEGHSQREKVTDPETTPKKLKCVCEMCTCGSNIKNVGKHHCPRPRIKGTYTTSYSSHYQNMPQLQKPPPQPEYQYQQRHYNPEDMRTSYQNTFTGEKVQSIPPPSTLEHVGVHSRMICRIGSLHMYPSRVGVPIRNNSSHLW